MCRQSSEKPIHTTQLHKYHLSSYTLPTSQSYCAETPTPAEEPSFTIRNSRILPAYSMMAPVCRLGAGRNSGGLVVSGSI